MSGIQEDIDYVVDGCNCDDCRRRRRVDREDYQAQQRVHQLYQDAVYNASPVQPIGLSENNPNIDPGYMQQAREEMNRRSEAIFREEIMRRPIAQGNWSFTDSEPPPIVQEDEFLEDDMQKLSSMTMRDAREKHYEVFKGPDDALRGKKEASLKYIESLGVDTQTDVSDWKLKDFFKGTKIITSRNEINKIFFKLKSKKAPSKEEKPKYVKAATLKELSRKINVDYQPRILTAEAAVLSANANLNEIKRQVTSWEREVENKQKAKQVLVDKAALATLHDYKMDLKKILKTGKFTIPVNQPASGLYLMTKFINKRSFNDNRAEALLVPLGKYLVHISVTTDGKWQHTIHTGEDNITVDDNYIHPHVSSNNLCAGAMGVEMQVYKDKGQFYEYIMLIFDILANFNDLGNPYRRLHQFEDAYKRKLKTKKI